MTDALMAVSRILGYFMVAFATAVAAEWARFGVVMSKGEPESAAWTAGLIGITFVIGFLLAFGGAKQ